MCSGFSELTEEAEGYVREIRRIEALVKRCSEDGVLSGGEALEKELRRLRVLWSAALEEVDRAAKEMER